MLILSNPYDDIVTYGQAEVANKIWCDAGAKTTFVRYHYKSSMPGTGLAHMMPGFKGADTALAFMIQLFNGTTPSKCTVRDIK